MVFSLKHRFLIFLLIPVVLFVTVTGFVSFLFARQHLLTQWEESAKLMVEKAAHQIRMQIDAKRDLADLIAQAEDIPNGNVTQAFLIQKLSKSPGVRFVDIETVGFPRGTPLSEVCKSCSQMAPGSAGHLCFSDQGVTPLQEGPGEKPLFGRDLPYGTIHHDPDCCRIEVDTGGPMEFLAIGKCFGGIDGGVHKRLTISVSFRSFLEPVNEIVKQKGSYACLVSKDGEYLAHTEETMATKRRLGETGNALEKHVLKEMKTKDYGTILGPGRPPATVAHFHKVPTTNDWYVILFSDGHVILEPIITFRRIFFIAGILAVIAIAYLIHLNTVPVAKSVREIFEASQRVEQGDYSGALEEDRSDEIGQLKAGFNRMLAGLKERDLIERTFGRYVGKNIARELMKRPEALSLGGEKHTVTIMMADLRGFTSTAEGLQPEEVIAILNRYFARMIAIIDQYSGIIVDFYGDSVLAFFNGIAADVPRRAADAVSCALAMQKELAALSDENVKEGLPELNMGVGIHTGEVVVGNIGSEMRAKYGIVGSPVNETDRIQSAADAGTVLVSEATYELLSDVLVVSDSCERTLKGLHGPRCLYEVASMTPKRVLTAEGGSPDRGTRQPEVFTDTPRTE